jgi:hypothetical protein
VDVDAKGAVPLFGGNIFDLLVRALEGGVVDQDVELPELGHGALDHALAVLLIRDVTRDKHDAAAGLLNPPRGLPGIVFLLGQVGDQDIGTFPRECDGDRPTDSGVPAGDDRGAALELARAFVRLFAMVRRGSHLGRAAGRLLPLLGLRRPRAGVPGILGHGWLLREGWCWRSNAARAVRFRRAAADSPCCTSSDQERLTDGSLHHVRS